MHLLDLKKDYEINVSADFLKEMIKYELKISPGFNAS